MGRKVVGVMLGTEQLLGNILLGFLLPERFFGLGSLALEGKGLEE